MSKRKKWILAAVIILAAGVLISGITFAVSGFDLNILDNSEYVTNTHEITEEFRDISVRISVDKVVFAPSEDGRCTVVCFEKEDGSHEVLVKDNTLIIKEKDGKNWFNFFSFSLQEPCVTVYLPGSEYEKLIVDASTGNIEIPEDFSFSEIDINLSTGNVICNASAKDHAAITATTGDIRSSGICAPKISLSVSTGQISASSLTCSDVMDVQITTGKAVLENINCNNLNTKGSTGDTVLKNVIASGELTAQCSTGDIRFDGCDAASIFAKTSTGDVTGTLLSDKVFITETGTGDVDVPKTIQGGKCEIITGTGDISIQILPAGF